MLSAATDAWQKEGYEVIGSAVPGATAMRLQADTKSDQGVTADSLITRFEHGHLDLDPNTVIVLDEAGMLDSERLSKLVRLAEQHGVKLVLTGDAAQLSSLGAGGLFKELEGKVPTAELTEVHRAHHQWEREAWLRSEKANPGPHSHATAPTTVSTSTTPAPRRPRRWSTTGIRTARACHPIRP